MDRESYFRDFDPDNNLLNLTQYGLPDDDTVVEALRAEREIAHALGRD